MILSEKILMIEPRGFSYNEETSADNFFQTTATLKAPVETAMKEFHELKNKLMKAGIDCLCGGRFMARRVCIDHIFAPAARRPADRRRARVINRTQ